MTAGINYQNILNIKVSKNDDLGNNGFIEGHEIIYRIWDCSAGSEYIVDGAQYFDNMLNQLNNQPFKAGASAFVELMAISQICQTLTFKPGWNLYSLPVKPNPAKTETIFQSLITNNSLVKIQDGLGNSMENWGIFGGWQDNIGDIYGFKIKVSKTDSTEICFKLVDYPYPIKLKSGWNIIGYPQITAFNGQEIVAQLIDRGTLIKVQDEGGNSIKNWGIFGGWINGISDFISGEGYKIKVNADDTFWIYDNYAKSTTILPGLVATTHFAPEFEGNGVDHMNINLVGLPINMLKAGDELAIFDGTTCVGAVTIMPYHLQNQSVSIAASATDNQGIAGFEGGNPIILKLWNSENNQEFTLEPEIVKGTSIFTKHETTVASLEKYATTGLDGMPGSNNTEINCYPNPFSDEVTVEINLATDVQVQVEVLNQSGQKVKILQPEKMLNSGNNLIKWNGKTSANQQVSAGIYYLKVTIGSVPYFKKVVFSKIE